MTAVLMPGHQSNAWVTVLEGVVLSGGPPLHVHEAADEVVIRVERDLACQGQGPGHETQRVVGPPLA